MHKAITLLLFFSFVSIVHSQNWTRIEPSSIRKSGERKIKPSAYLLARIDDADMKKKLWSSPSEHQGRIEKDQELRVMLSDGIIDVFTIREYEMMEEGLAAAFPDFKTFLGTSQVNPFRSIRIDYTLNGFRALISEPGKNTYIDPYQTGDLSSRIIYTRSDISEQGDWRCLVANKKPVAPESSSNRFAGDCKLRTYRLAVAATAEYTIFHGGSVAAGQAAIVTAMNRVNQVFEQDISVRMILVANNSNLVYTDAATDPYTNNSAGTLLNENITNLDNVIGNANYDIGHVFCTTDSGVAYTPSVCYNASKGGGVTGQGSPVNDPFWIDYVAHEMGHQFGGNHTQNNDCNRASGAAMEPGSASTIMGYAGICSPNVQSNSDPYFHAHSIAEMTAHITGTSCANVVNISNTPPSINAVQNYTVPRSTFLVLEASATDNDGDALTYCWEQMDPEVGVMPPQSTNPVGPVFRSISPTASGKRYLPNLQAIIANTTPTWEVLPSVSRTMKFRATVRDHIASLACTDETNMTITVDGNSGPFLASEAISGVSFTGGQTLTYTWTVAGTNNAPVSCSNVDILLSTDGGLTYPTVVLANTPNDGSQSISIPAVSTTTARLMVKCSDNIFFDINNADFEISGGATSEFAIATSPSSGAVCNNSSIQFALTTSATGGFSTPINLSASALPPGATAGFSINPVVPGSTSTVTLSNFGSQVGNYTIVITGQAGGITKTNNYELTLNPLPGVPTLTTPANNASNVSLDPALSWHASSNAVSYNVQVSTSIDFSTNVLSYNENVAQANVTGLNSSTKYFWRVRAVNACGNSAFSSAFNFTTAGTTTEVCSTYSSEDVPKNIGVNNIIEHTSSLNIPLNQNITDLDLVNLEGRHTYIADLEFILRGPGATEVILFSGICSDQDNFDLNFDDAAASSTLPCPPIDGLVYQPAGQLSDFNGKNAGGEWTLILRDLYQDDEGMLNSWGLKVCYETTGGCDLTVTNTNPTGAASLLDAVGCAQSGNTITINLPANSIINLGENSLIINNNLNILSNNPVFLDYTAAGAAIEVKSGAQLKMENITIRQLP